MPKTPKMNSVEGSWFAIPLESGGYGVGLVARATARGPIILAYLFGPKRAAVPSLADVSTLAASSAVKVARVGDLHLLKGRWPLIGQAADFSREAWPFPQFQRSNDLSRKGWIVEYEDDNPGEVRMETPMPKSEVLHLEKDGVMGAGYAEALLTQLLGDATGDDDRTALQAPGDVAGTTSRGVRHFLYISDQDAANKLAADLRQEGLQVECRLGADDVNWLVLIRQTVVGDAAFEEASDRFEALAEKFGGEYDGWEAEEHPG